MNALRLFALLPALLLPQQRSDTMPNGKHRHPRRSNREIRLATADCRDGTHSFTAHHKGACSKHGGVARWR